MAIKSGMLALLVGLLLSSCAPVAGQVVIRGGGYYGTPRSAYGNGPRYYQPRSRVLLVPPPPVVVYPAPYYAAPPRAYYPVRPHRWGGYGWRRYY